MIKKILLIEYDQDSVDAIKDLLHHEIFDIAVAGSEAVAKALLAKQHFHLVITEALLPKSHGFNLCKYICDNYPETKVIIISDKLDKKDYKKEAMRHGAADFFEKPLEVPKFRKKVLKSLGIKEPGQKQDEDVNQTTNLHILPLLDELEAEKEIEKQSETSKFNAIIEDVKKREPDYQIDLD